MSGLDGIIRKAFESREHPPLDFKKDVNGDYVFAETLLAWRDFYDGYIAAIASVDLNDYFYDTD